MANDPLLDTAMVPVLGPDHRFSDQYLPASQEQIRDDTVAAAADAAAAAAAAAAARGLANTAAQVAQAAATRASEIAAGDVTAEVSQQLAAAIADGLVGAEVSSTDPHVVYLTIPPNQIAPPAAATTTSSATRLHSTQPRLKFVMYWPRQAPFMDWWPYLADGTISWGTVGAELDQLKTVLGINCVRVFTYYNWVHGKQTERIAQLDQFITLAATKGLDVLVTTYQILPALRPTEDWSFLENDLTSFAAFHTTLLTMLRAHTNVMAYNLLNEPDGYGVWDNYPLAGRVLKWLKYLRDLGKAVAPRLLCVVNTVTHDNAFKRFPPPAPGDAGSVYDLTDVVAQNSFRWVDTGDWPGQNYQTQVAYMLGQNLLSKPVIMTECGFPASYDQQAVAGSGGATVTEESIVPQGDVFDRPQGRTAGMPHSPANQARAVGEAVAIAERYDLDGLGIWSAYDHRNDAAPYVYRDPFGVIDRDGNPRPACAVFRAAFTETYPVGGQRRMSLSSGTTWGNARINGLQGYDTATPANNTRGGVYLPPGGGGWASGQLAMAYPAKVLLELTVRSLISVDEPIIVRLTTAGKQMDWRFKRYTVNSWQRLTTSGADVDRGFAANSPVFGAGEHTVMVDLADTTMDPHLVVDGIVLDYTAAGPEPLAPWMIAEGFTVTIINNSNVGMDLRGMYAVGTPGEPMPINRRLHVPQLRVPAAVRRLT